MNKLFWLRKNLLAGRTGPNLDSWDVSEFKESGFSAILSVNDGEMVHESLIKAVGLEYANIPMSSNAPVRAGDKDYCLRNLPKAMSFIGKNLVKGPVLIHCRSGKDRTGMVLAACLIALESMNAEDAINEILSVRDIAFSAEGWVDFGLDVLNTFYAQNKSMLADSLGLATN